MSRNKKSRGSGVGAFFGGTFVGFIICIALLAGLGAFIYFKVSPKWLNDTFNANIDLGNEQRNSLTLDDIVTHAISLSKNTDTYTLNDLKNDFGIDVGDKLMGLDITDLKNVGLSDLSEAVKNKISNISAYELDNEESEVIDLSDMENILLEENTYYYKASDAQLYTDAECTPENVVSKTNDFDYSVETEESDVYIKIKKQRIKVEDGKINVQLQYLPLTYAISSYTSNLGDNITLEELYSDYGVELPKYIYNPETKKNGDKTINEISSIIDELYIAEIMGYTIDGNKVMNGIEEITGPIAKVAKEQVKNLSNLESVIDTFTIAEVMDYRVHENEGTKIFYEDKNENGEYDEGEELTGVLSLIENLDTLTMDGIPNAINNVIKEKDLNTLVEKGVITLDDDDKQKLGNSISYDTTDDDVDNPTSITIGELKIEQLLDYCFDLIP